MSLINDVLRNIEAKRPDDLARHKLQREIRALPAGRSRSGWAARLLGGLAAVLVLGAGILYTSRQVAGPAAGPQPLSAPATEMPPVVSLSAAASPAAVVPAEPVDTLRLSAQLSALPQPAPPVLGVPDPLPPSSAPPAKAESALPVGPVKIEKSLLAPTPRDKADAELRRAETALASGRSGEALDALRAAVKLDPGHVAARQALLRQLLDARKVDEAMLVLQDGLENMPMQTGWAVSLARLQLEQGDLAGADRTLAYSQGYAEANADYAGFQGHVKSRLGAHRQAIAHYQRATRLAPGEGRWWLGLGLAFEADGRGTEARDALRRAIASGTLNHDLAAVAEQHLRP